MTSLKFEINCPRCNGCGKIKVKKVISKDKTKKFCRQCNDFLPIELFYHNTGLCKPHHNAKLKPKRAAKVKEIFSKKCEICGNNYKTTTKDQWSCSQKCHGKRMYLTLKFKRAAKLLE